MMSEALWTSVDGLLADVFGLRDEMLDAAQRDSEAAGLPAISITPNVGKLLHMMARMRNARRILEIGTLGGYSTIWLARALEPGGRLITLEIDAKHAEVARRNIVRAGLADVVDVRLGPAIELLPIIADENGPPFDFVFIDADKESNPAYFEWAMRLTKPGSVIVVDNVIRKGGILDESSADVSVRGVQRLLAMMGNEKRITATALQTVGSKGYDGFAVALVLSLDE